MKKKTTIIKPGPQRKPVEKPAPEIPAKNRIQVIVSGTEYLEILHAALAIDRNETRSGKADEPISFTPRSISAYCAEKILGRPSSLRGRGRPKIRD